MSTPTPQYRSDIDGIRSIAVLSVVLFHAFPTWLKGGFIGVDIFFVISGFLISTILFTKLQNQTFSFLDFYWRRSKRIFPALLLVLLSTYLFAWFFLWPTEFKQFAKHVASGASFTSNFTLLKESGYFDISSDRKPLLHLWSLAIEEQFYIIWPILLYLGFKRRINLLILCLVMFSASLIFSVSIQSNYPAINFYSPASRFWEISSGAILAYLHLQQRTFISNRYSVIVDNVKSLMGISMIAFAIIALDSKSTFPGAWALLPAIGTCLLISAGPKAFINQKILSHSSLVWFGLISYPLYLWHWPLLSFAHILKKEAPGKILASTIILISILLAWLTYKIIEKPIRFKKYDRSLFMSLCSAIFITFAIGRLTYKYDGFSKRLPEQIKQYANIDFNWNQEVRKGLCYIEDSDKNPADDCVEKRHHNIMLWGDSHAASIYPGLKQIKEKYDIGITQLTKGSCPPLLDFKNPEVPSCFETNQRTWSIALNTKPDVILLHGDWSNIDEINNEQVIELLLKTIRSIQTQIPSANIIVLGPVTRWKDTVQNIMINSFFQKGDSDKLPDYINQDLRLEVPTMDAFMKERLKKSGALYISTYDILCNKNGCLAKTGPLAKDLTSVDGAHLSASGSQYLMSHVLMQIRPEDLFSLKN